MTTEIKTIEGKYFNIENIGTHGLKITLSDDTKILYKVIVDKEDFKRLIKELKQ
jgi:hypothetical protein